MDCNIHYRMSACPACNHNIAVEFFDGHRQPLATLGWPETATEAREMERLRLDFVRCVDCGHVFNTAFDYNKVPYSRKPNLMFNAGHIWSGFLAETHSKLCDRLSENPVVVEIGYGDGGFLSALATLKPAGRYIGFDPHGADVDHPSIETRNTLFRPSEHLAELKPDILISRHVLEHLHNPLGFLQELSFSSTTLGLAPLAYFEVPCIDNVIESFRTVDFYFEHSSQFTTTSFERMLSRAGVRIDEIGHGYDGEVVFSVVKMGSVQHQLAHSREAANFHQRTEQAKTSVAADLQALLDSGRRIAVWGGTGKSAAFMCRYDMDSDRFPIVVDSDPMKVGTHVPGTGQEIRFRDYLKEQPVEVLIIPPQWRARDIVSEMASCGISVDLILIEHGGRLTDFLEEPHIYCRASV